MAELSAETAAIVERLRAEGDLVRNSGANSIRSVKIKLDRFDGLFTSIQTNIAEQTQILRQQAGVQEAATEAAKRQEDFENLKAEREVVAQKDNRAAQEDRDAKLIDGMRNAFSLKNLALGAGGAFLGYNLLKGAIDDQFNGAFSNMEQSLSNFNPAMIQETFNQLQTTVASMNDAVQTLNQTILGLEEDVEAFKNSLAVKALTLLASIPLGFAVARGLARGIPAAVREYRSGQLDKDDPRGNQIRRGESEAARIRRLAAEEAERVRAAEVERARAAEVERARANARAVETERFQRASRASEMRLRANRIPLTTTFVPEGANYLPDNLNVPTTSALPANSNMPRNSNNVVPFRTQPSSLATPAATPPVPRVITAPAANVNRPATRSDLTKLLQEYNDKIPAKWRNAILKIFDFLAKANIAFKLIDLTIMLGIMGEADESERHRLLGSFVGGIVGAGGGAFLGGLIGAFGGPFAWITAPAGAIAGGILGGYGGDWLGYKMVEWALGDSPPPGEIEAVNAQILSELASVSQGAGVQALMAESAARYGTAGETTTTGVNYGMPAQPGLGASTIPGMGVGSGSVYPNAKLSSAQARRIVNLRPGFETNALDAIAATALMNGNVIVVNGGDQTVSPVITQQGGSVSVEAPTIIGNHMDRNMNTYASGPYPGVVYE